MISNLKNFIFGGSTHNESTPTDSTETRVITTPSISPINQPPSISDSSTNRIIDTINLRDPQYQLFDRIMSDSGILSNRASPDMPSPIPRENLSSLANLELQSFTPTNLARNFNFASIEPPFLSDEFKRNHLVNRNEIDYLTEKYDSDNDEIKYRIQRTMETLENPYPSPESRFPIKREGMTDILNDDQLKSIDEYTYETLKDPVTLQLMEFPLIASNGRTYSAHTLFEIFKIHPVKDPITREPLEYILDRIGIKNEFVQQTIDKYIAGKFVKFQQGGKKIIKLF